MLPKTLSLAINQGVKYYFTGKPCKNGHIAPRYIRNKGCLKCLRLRTKKWRIEKPEAYRLSAAKSSKVRYERHKEKILDRTKKYRIENREKLNAARRIAHAKNPNQRNVKNREWRNTNIELARSIEKQSRQNNRGAVNERRREYQIRKMRQMPPWADREAIRRIYNDAARITLETGISHHVDHIIPLKGRLISGLHVHQNLQILPARDNIKKGNRFDGR